MLLHALVLLPALLLTDPASATDDYAAHADAPVEAVSPNASPAAPAPSAEPPRSFAEPPAVGTQALCPVMQEVFTVEAGTQVEEYEGRFYAFCCSGCVKKFKAQPKKYADPTL
jgi:YHS domain-containing protein